MSAMTVKTAAMATSAMGIMEPSPDTGSDRPEPADWTLVWLSISRKTPSCVLSLAVGACFGSARKSRLCRFSL